jgi:hypothetical protein
MRRKCISLVGDRAGHCYCIPTPKAAKFEAWVTYVNGGKEKYYGEDFSDYRCDRPLGTLVLANPYRRFSRRRTRVRDVRDIRNVRD